jgi:hypothetical protein
MTQKETEILAKTLQQTLASIYQLIYPNRQPESPSAVLAHVRQAIAMKDREIKEEGLRADLAEQRIEPLRNLLEQAYEAWSNDFPRSSLHVEVHKALYGDVPEEPDKPAALPPLVIDDDDPIGQVIT